MTNTNLKPELPLQTKQRIDEITRFNKENSLRTHPQTEWAEKQLDSHRKAIEAYERSENAVNLLADQLKITGLLNPFALAMWKKCMKEFPEKFEDNYSRIKNEVSKDQNAIFQIYANFRGFDTYAALFDHENTSIKELSELIGGLSLSAEGKNHKELINEIKMLRAEIKSLKDK